MKSVAAIVLCLVGAAMAQDGGVSASRQDPHDPVPAKPSAKDSQRKVTPEEKRGVELLKRAESQARSLEDPGMRTFAMMRAAQVYVVVDKKRALQLLEDALTVARSVEDGDSRLHTRQDLEHQIVSTTVRLDPYTADTLMDSMAPELRRFAIDLLMGHYLKQQQFDRALELVYGLGREDEIPYSAATELMGALPPERSADMLQLFSVAFASYRDHGPETFTLGSVDFTRMIVYSWRQLPPALVRDAIDQVLAKAKEADGTTKASIYVVGREEQAIAVDSTYSMRLFQLMPIIRELDPSRADELLRASAPVAALVQRFPNGPFGAGITGPVQGSVSYGSALATPGPAGPDAAEIQLMAQIRKDAPRDLGAALAEVGTLRSSWQKAQMLDEITGGPGYIKLHVASSAIDKMAEIAAQLEPEDQVKVLRRAVQLYLAQGDSENARKLLEKAFAATEKVYKKDSDPEDPNKALKAFWPSANLWAKLILLASGISPDLAAALTREVPDEEIRTVEQITLAGSVLKAPLQPIPTVYANKNRMRMETDAPEPIVSLHERLPK